MASTDGQPVEAWLANVVTGRPIAAVLPDPRAERRRRLAEPDLEFWAFCAPPGIARASSTAQLERAWDAWQAGRLAREMAPLARTA